MQLRCIRDFSQYRAAHADADGGQVPADVVEVPDGAAYDDFHWEPADAAAAAASVAREQERLAAASEDLAAASDALAQASQPPPAPPVQFPAPAPKEM